MAKEKKEKTPGYEEFHDALQSGAVGNVYIFHGEETYLMQQAVAELQARLVPAGFEEFNYHRLAGKGLTMQEVVEAAEAMPMMAERTLVTVEDMDLFRLDEAQRGALVAIGERIFERDCPDFRLRYNQSHFGRTFVHSILYTLSAGVTHSVQYAMAAMLRAASDGRLDFTSQVSEYGRRAARLKRVLCDNGFHVVYDTDVDERVGDGFFFTFGYKQMSSEQLINKLIYYGVSAIPLSGTGSDRHGLRACTSSIDESQYELLDRRLRRFAQDY